MTGLATISFSERTFLYGVGDVVSFTKFYKLNIYMPRSVK